MHTFQYLVLIFAGKPSNITIKDCSEGIAIDNFPPAGLVMGRKPGGKTTQFRYDTAILTGHQGEHSPDRKAGPDSFGEIPAGEEFGDLPVGRSDVVFSG